MPTKKPVDEEDAEIMLDSKNRSYSQDHPEDEKHKLHHRS
jgi:hypothetical protein